MKFKYKHQIGLTWRDLKPGVRYSVEPFVFSYHKHTNTGGGEYTHEQVMLTKYKLHFYRRAGLGSADLTNTAYLDTLVFIPTGENK